MRTPIPGLFLLFFTVSLFAQPNEIFLRVGKSGGLFGGGKPRYVRIALSTKTLEADLNSVNVNEGNFYYFSCRTSKEWKMDTKFVEKELPNITIQQGEKLFNLEYRGSLIREGDSTAILIGFSRALRLDQPLVFQFPQKKDVVTAELTIPEQFWPGYDQYFAAYQRGNRSLDKGRHKQAIRAYDEILTEPSSAMFSFHGDAVRNRTRSFAEFLDLGLKTFSKLTSDLKVPLPEVIRETERLLQDVTLVVDSLSNPLADLSPDVGAIRIVSERARDAGERMQLLLEVYRHQLDEQNTRWIIEGSASAVAPFKYIYMMETLAYAFTSLEFEDTTATPFLHSLSPELESRLVKFGLKESYDTFIRLCNKLWKTKRELYPKGFLENVKEDSVYFVQPYYFILKSVEDYFKGNLAECRESIRNALINCFDLELSGRLDELRQLTLLHGASVAPRARKLLEEGKRLEAQHNPDGALEKYKTALLIAPDLPHAAFALGKFHDAAGDPYRANNYFGIVLTQDPRNLLALRHSYRNHMRQGNFKPMIELLRNALANGNEYWEVYYYLGYAYNATNQFGEAIDQYRTALELNPNSYDANIQIGLAFQNMKNFPKAREYYVKALQLNPEDQTAIEFMKKLDEIQKKY
ncbi:MAG: tetratricopeptide repeat protein [Bacteroidota bacterium]